MKHPAYAGGRTADFAHLMGAPVGRARAEQDDDKDKAAKARKARRAAEDKRRAEEDERRKTEDAKRAEEDGTDMDDDLDNRDEPDHEETPDPSDMDDILDEHERNKDDEEDPDEVTDDVGPNDSPQSAKRKGKKAERARWTKVLGHKEAAGRVGAACSMLANGDMTADAVIATLKTLPQQGPQGRTGLRERMSAERPANPGANGGGPKHANQAAADAAAIVEAGRRRRGEA